MDKAWPAPPLITGAWRTLPLDQACAVMSRVAAAELEQDKRPSAWTVDYLRVRALPLVCGPRWLLMEAQARFADGEHGYLTFLFGPRRQLLLADWVPATLRNCQWAQRWQTDPLLEVEEYVRLFVCFTNGDAGRFCLFESLDALRAALARDTSLPPALELAFQPLALSVVDDGFRATATVGYNGFLFLATFHIDHDGQVEMIDDREIGPLPLRAEELRGPFRVFPPGPNGRHAHPGGNGHDPAGGDASSVIRRQGNREDGGNA